MRRPYDVVAMIFGLLVTGVALGSLWQTFVGPLNWGLVKIIAPLGLVAVGVLGLAMSRNRPPTPKPPTQKGSS
jgi:hypothetical protein